MRILILVMLLLANTIIPVNAQCYLPNLKKELKEKEKQMEPDAFIAYLLQMDTTFTLKNDKCSSAIVKERISSYYYERDAEKCIEYRKMAGALYDEAGDKINAIFCRQNIAFVYDEQLHDYPAALEYAQKALNEWEWVGDTLQQANMYKYIGPLWVKLGNFAKGEAAIMKAVELYRAQNNEAGLAVTYFNYGNMLADDQKPPGAALFLNLARTYWKKQDNYTRLAAINNKLIEQYLLFDEWQATVVFNETIDFIDKEEVYWKDKLNFLKIAQDYFFKTGKPEEVEKYAAEYKEFKASLEKKGLKTE